MRFAYIDSQGKEVPIPTVDALRLRIALRAIVEDTEFYDSTSDRWAPAAEHEIFRTLRKELDEQEGESFVAPPPVEGLSDDEPLQVEESDETVVPREDGDEEWRFAISNAPTDRSEGGAPDATDPPPQELLEDEDDPAPLGSSSWLDLEGNEESAEFDLDDAHFQELDDEDEGDEELLLVPEMGGPEPDVVDLEEPEVAEEPVVGEMELEGPDFLEPTGLAHGVTSDPVDAAPMEGLSQDRFDEAAPLEAVGWGDEPPPPPGDDLGVLEVEEEAEAPAPPAPRGRPTPPDDIPVPTREELLARRAEAGGRGPSRPRPTPGPPPRPRRRSPGGAAMLGVVALVVVVAGGAWWYANQSAEETETAQELPPMPPVAIPDLPVSLEPRMEAMAADVRGETLAALRQLPSMELLPAEPDPAWLAGIYLANASQYPEVQGYWEAMDRFLRVMQAAEDSLFQVALSGELAAAALPPDTADLLEERILAGFRATARDRGVVYQRARGVAEASLRLHRFLMENEASIEYEPGLGGIAADPVLEVIPATPQLGEEMWERVGDITEAMDALDFLDRVTTERLVDAVVQRLAEIPLR